MLYSPVEFKSSIPLGILRKCSMCWNNAVVLTAVDKHIWIVTKVILTSNI